MKVKEVEIAKEVMRSDGWWRFACGDVFYRTTIEINSYSVAVAVAVAALVMDIRNTQPKMSLVVILNITTILPSKFTIDG